MRLIKVSSGDIINLDYVQHVWYEHQGWNGAPISSLRILLAPGMTMRRKNGSWQREDDVVEVFNDEAEDVWRLIEHYVDPDDRLEFEPPRSTTVT